MAIFEPTDVPFLPATDFFAAGFVTFESFAAFSVTARRTGFIAFLIARLATGARFGDCFAACFGAGFDECARLTGGFALAFAFFAGFAVCAAGFAGRFACCFVGIARRFDGFAFFAFAMVF